MDTLFFTQIILSLVSIQLPLLFYILKEVMILKGEFRILKQIILQNRNEPSNQKQAS